MNSSVGLIVLFALGGLAALVIWAVWQQIHPNRADQWPVTEGTIQSTGTEIIYAGRGSSEVPVCDFSYQVGGQYYSGRLSISSRGVPDEGPMRDLMGRKIPVHYDPGKPSTFFVPSTNVDGFSVGQHYENLFATDTQPTALNIDKN